MKTYLATLSIVLISLCAYSQEAALDTDTIRKDALKVYFPDADSYIKKEIMFINYVRDLKEADVYIIVTSQSSGSGGDLYTAFFVGQHKYAGMNDTIMISESPDETEDVFRRKAVGALKMGFMRYMLKTPLSEFFDIKFTRPVKETVESDKWDSWVFRTSLSGSLDGERSYKSIYLSGSQSASRVTEKSKLQAYLSFSWRNEKYGLNDSITEYSFSRSQAGNLYYAKSLTDHWSLGFTTSISASTYGYYDLRYSLTPAIEYDIFPYSESTRRQLRITYMAGYNYNNYIDTTIFNKTYEHLGIHDLTLSWEVVQKWGSADLSVSWSNYFHDWSKNNLGAYLYMSVRIAKGINVSFSGSAQIINDQLSLPKGGVSDTDILLRRRMTETKFNYYGYFGLSYTFGSIYNNAVNPRFGW